MSPAQSAVYLARSNSPTPKDNHDIQLPARIWRAILYSMNRQKWKEVVKHGAMLCTLLSGLSFILAAAAVRWTNWVVDAGIFFAASALACLIFAASG